MKRNAYAVGYVCLGPLLKYGGIAIHLLTFVGLLSLYGFFVALIGFFAPVLAEMYLFGWSSRQFGFFTYYDLYLYAYLIVAGLWFFCANRVTNMEMIDTLGEMRIQREAEESLGGSS